MEDNMQQKYEKYMNATKVERIYTRRGDDSIYVDGTIAIKPITLQQGFCTSCGLC